MDFVTRENQFVLSAVAKPCGSRRLPFFEGSNMSAQEILDFEFQHRPNRDTNLRSLLKTLSWRIVATATTILIAWFVFGDVSSAIKVGSIEFFAKMVIYYFHERLWQ